MLFNGGLIVADGCFLVLDGGGIGLLCCLLFLHFFLYCHQLTIDLLKLPLCSRNIFLLTALNTTLHAEHLHCFGIICLPPIHGNRVTDILCRQSGRYLLFFVTALLYNGTSFLVEDDVTILVGFILLYGLAVLVELRLFFALLRLLGCDGHDCYMKVR